MDNFWDIVLYPIGVALLMLPFALVLILATIVANLFSGVFKPITDPIRSVLETVSERVPNPLDKIPSFPKIKQHFGSTKNILFVCFVIIYLLFHYLSIETTGVALTNISLLFPGSAFDVLLSFIISQGQLDQSTFIIGPEHYLWTIISFGITGLFLHIGCTTKQEGAKIHFLVKLVYILLITLFSSVVLEKIPSEMFTVSLPAYSAQLEPASIVINTANAEMLLATLQQVVGILLEKLVTLIPVIVAVCFLCQSVSSFTAAFLGGLFALAVLSVACPEVFLNPYSPLTSILLLGAVTLAEAVALLFGDFVSNLVDRLLEKIKKVFDYYNIISLSISYFFYPALVLPVLTFLSFYSKGFNFASWLICIACLIVFSLVTFAGYKINQWVWKREEVVNFKKYVIFMIINIPILLIYSAIFKI